MSPPPSSRTVVTSSRGARPWLRSHLGHGSSQDQANSAKPERGLVGTISPRLRMNNSPQA